MKPLLKKLELSKEQYYSKHLSIINVFLPKKLTPKEIEVISLFMSLRGDIAEDRFGTSARKIVMNHMGIQPGGLGNYLKALKEKEFIREDENGNLSLLPILFPSEPRQGYMFKLEMKEDDTK